MNSAARPGRCSRRSKRPAAPTKRSTRGVIQNKVAETRAAREKAIATRKDPLTGTSEFPHLSEKPVSVLDVARIVPQPSGTPALTFPALTPMRLSEPFEALRDASDRDSEENRRAPENLPRQSRQRRPTSSRAPCSRAISSRPAASRRSNSEAGADLAAAFKQSGAKLACLCSSDEVYARDAVAAAKALGAAGVAHIYLAAVPASSKRRLSAAGVKTFIYAGCDALRTLCAAHDSLGLR